MTDELKSQYARRLETTAPNWVTGVSNPWIMGYEVVGRENVSATCRKFRLSFTTATSAGTAGTHTAVLVIVQEENFWRVQQIFTGEGLYPYTRF